MPDLRRISGRARAAWLGDGLADGEAIACEHGCSGRTDCERRVDGRALTELYFPTKAGFRPYAFELATAFAWLLTGLTALLDPATLIHSSVGRDVAPFAAIWSGLYVAGAVAIVTGIARPFPALRVAGLLLLATGLCMQTVAAISFDFTPKAAVPAVYALAALTRSLMLVVMIRRVDRAAHA